jgi:plastocyanin
MAPRPAVSPGIRAGIWAVLAVALAGLVACSNQQGPVNRRPHPGTATASSVDGIQQVDVDAGDTYRFDPSRITVHPGTVRIVLHNTGTGAPHNLTFLAFGAATPLAGSGKTQSVMFTAPAPGQYQFVCTIHERQGQTGTLVVQSG